MINADMRFYDYFTLGEYNEAGERVEPTRPAGQIKMAINIASQSIQDNINYTDCAYVGLTHNKQVNDKWLIDYNGNKLKVLYVNPKGRFIQVFLAKR